MPILISLKEPGLTLVVAGDIEDTPEAVKEWDRIFQKGALITKTTEGDMILIPIWKESNIAFMKGVTEKELEKQRAEQKKRMEEAAKNNPSGQGGSIIKTPDFLFPSSSGRKRPG